MEKKKQLANLRFADDVALFNKKKLNKWKQNAHLKLSELRKSENWPKVQKTTTKYATNHADSKDILNDQEINRKQ